MNGGALFWLAVGAAAAALFFGIAAVVIVRGVRDLRDLLGGSERRDGKPR